MGVHRYTINSLAAKYRKCGEPPQTTTPSGNNPSTGPIHRNVTLTHETTYVESTDYRYQTRLFETGLGPSVVLKQDVRIKEPADQVAMIPFYLKIMKKGNMTKLDTGEKTYVTSQGKMKRRYFPSFCEYLDEIKTG